MPVRSLHSAVFKWPNDEQVLAGARQWALALSRRDRNVDLVACIGSYARGDWGVGSDLDMIVVFDGAELSPLERRKRYEPQGLPVPVDLWVYSRAEWRALAQRAPQLWTRLQRELQVLSDRQATT